MIEFFQRGTTILSASNVYKRAESCQLGELCVDIEATPTGISKGSIVYNVRLRMTLCGDRGASIGNMNIKDPVLISLSSPDDYDHLAKEHDKHDAADR